MEVEEVIGFALCSRNGGERKGNEYAEKERRCPFCRVALIVLPGIKGERKKKKFNGQNRRGHQVERDRGQTLSAKSSLPTEPSSLLFPYIEMNEPTLSLILLLFRAG